MPGRCFCFGSPLACLIDLTAFFRRGSFCLFVIFDRHCITQNIVLFGFSCIAISLIKWSLSNASFQQSLAYFENFSRYQMQTMRKKHSIYEVMEDLFTSEECLKNVFKISCTNSWWNILFLLFLGGGCLNGFFFKFWCIVIFLFQIYFTVSLFSRSFVCLFLWSLLPVWNFCYMLFVISLCLFVIKCMFQVASTSTFFYISFHLAKILSLQQDIQFQDNKESICPSSGPHYTTHIAIFSVCCFLTIKVIKLLRSSERFFFWFR